MSKISPLNYSRYEERFSVNNGSPDERWIAPEHFGMVMKLLDLSVGHIITDWHTEHSNMLADRLTVSHRWKFSPGKEREWSQIVNHLRICGLGGLDIERVRVMVLQSLISFDAYAVYVDELLGENHGTTRSI